MLECLESMEPYLTPNNQIIYNFERAIQAPLFDIMTRGWLIDEHARRQGIESLHQRRQHVQDILNTFALEVWDAPLNPNSDKQMQEFLYDKMQLPVQYKHEKGQKKITVNRDALEKLDSYSTPDQ